MGRGGGEGFRVRGSPLNSGDYVTSGVTALVLTINDGLPSGTSPSFNSGETLPAFAGTIEGEVVGVPRPTCARLAMLL